MAYAKNQLGRVLKLTTALEQLENNIIDKVVHGPYQHDIDYVMNALGTLHKSLDKIMGLLQKVYGDDELMQVIVNKADSINLVSQQENNTYNMNMFSDAVTDPSSREKLRNVVSEILGDLNEVSKKGGEEKPKTIDLEIEKK